MAKKKKETKKEVLGEAKVGRVKMCPGVQIMKSSAFQVEKFRFNLLNYLRSSKYLEIVNQSFWIQRFSLSEILNTTNVRMEGKDLPNPMPDGPVGAW